MTPTTALFLDGPLHGQTREIPPSVTRVEVKTFEWNGIEQVEAGEVVYVMGDDYEAEGEFAGAIHFRLKQADI